MTTDILTPAELDAIRGRCEAATAGPWAVPHPAHPGAVLAWDNEIVVYNEGAPGEHDAAFIAHARADIPRLLAHVAALEAAIPRVSLISRAACIVGESGSEEIAAALDDAAAAIRALMPQPTQEPQP